MDSIINKSFRGKIKVSVKFLLYLKFKNKRALNENWKDIEKKLIFNAVEVISYWFGFCFYVDIKRGS
jgi:hypothetical protein